MSSLTNKTTEIKFVASWNSYRIECLSFSLCKGEEQFSGGTAIARLDENRERRAIFDGFRTIVERPFRFRYGGGVDRSSRCNCYYAAGKNGRWPLLFDRLDFIVDRLSLCALLPGQQPPFSGLPRSKLCSKLFSDKGGEKETLAVATLEITLLFFLPCFETNF